MTDTTNWSDKELADYDNLLITSAKGDIIPHSVFDGVSKRVIQAFIDFTESLLDEQ